MSTPYDTDDELLAEHGTSWRIRTLNDEFRTQPSLIGPAVAENTLVITSGVRLSNSLRSESVTPRRQPGSSIATPSRAKLFREEPEAGNLHIRDCARIVFRIF